MTDLNLMDEDDDDFMSGLTDVEREVLLTLAESVATPHCEGEDGVGCLIDEEGPEKIARIYCIKCGHVYVEARESEFDLVLYQCGSVH
jgi:hypothetical protein